jgi:lipid-A-disaccharide synthase
MHKLGIPVVYYVSPQVWAWGKRRIPTIARLVRKMLVIFPFEQTVYAGTGLDVEFVGHPLLTILKEQRIPELVRDPSTVLLLPGSRLSEIGRLLGPMLDTAAWLSARHPRLKFVVAVPRSVIAEKCRRILADWQQANSTRLPVGIETGVTHKWLQAAATGLAASGTVTMECAMLGLPVVTVYRLNPLTYTLGRWLVKLPFFTIVNLVTGKRVFEEFLQNQVRADVLGPAVERILPAGVRRADVEQGMREAVLAVSGNEGGDASRRAACAVLKVVDTTNACSGSGQ